ncbi:hypothetical protein CON35_26995 [Bacillus cereus]|nr:hypothetical protein CON35_26995 [Bacillus cereus]
MLQKSQDRQANEYMKYAILIGNVLHQHHLAMNCTPILQVPSKLVGDRYILSYGKSGMYVSHKKRTRFYTYNGKKLI